MTNEYISRYQGLSHQDLYNALQAGDPNQIDGQAAGWRTIESTTRQVADDLSNDIAKLAPDWGGSAGEEYQRRLGLVSDFALRLSDDQSMVKRGLETLSSHLTTAKSKAESPQATDDNDKLLSGAAKGAAVGSVLGTPGTVAGAIIGGAFGHDQDEKEQEAAKDRMVQLVATLAADYVTNAQADLQTPTVEPPDLPGSGESSARGGTGATDPRGVPVTGRSGAGNGDDLGSAHATELTSGGSQQDLSTIGGDGNGGLAAVGTATAAGAGLIVARQLPLGASGLAGAGMPGGLPAGGVLASGPMVGTAGAGSPGGRVTTTSLTGSVGSGHGLQAGAAGESMAGRGGLAPRGGMVGGQGVAGGSRRETGTDDEAEEYTSWLTEDEMDWGAGDGLPPAVLGGQPDLA